MLDQSEARRSGVSTEMLLHSSGDYRIRDNISTVRLSRARSPSGSMSASTDGHASAVEESSAVRSCTEVIELTAFWSRQQARIVQGWGLETTVAADRGSLVGHGHGPRPWPSDLCPHNQPRRQQHQVFHDEFALGCKQQRIAVLESYLRPN